MSHVDTSIGFSLHSEPPVIASVMLGSAPNLIRWRKRMVAKRLEIAGPVAFIVPCGSLITRHLDKGWQGWAYLGRGVVAWLVASSMALGLMWLFYQAKYQRQERAMRVAGFDSPIVHFTAEGQWITFLFASGREFVDRWDRLLRFKTGADFTEFEFPANPPIIIPTQSIPEETRATIAQFCAIEKIPSETKR